MKIQITIEAYDLELARAAMEEVIKRACDQECLEGFDSMSDCSFRFEVTED